MSEKQVKIIRALLSVSDKEGLADLAQKLVSYGVEIISSGGTAKYLCDAGIVVTPIEKVTGNPEAFGGRMKTLSFQVSSALLFRRNNADDVKQAQELGVQPIDLVVCNLYPFEDTVRKGALWDELIENIDIGGPTLIRAAAKNHTDVAVVTDPAQYAAVIRDLHETGGNVRAETRLVLAREAFRLTSRYDAAIAAMLEDKTGAETRTIHLSAAQAAALRYGENPHQKSWVYADTLHTGIAGTAPLQGKELSYNNLLDADAAWRTCGDVAMLRHAEFPATVAIIKHLTPCGVAAAKTPLAALELAWAGDTISSFGGILAFNQTVDADVATWLGDRFVEVVIAPTFTTDALAIFATKKNLRLLQVPVYSGLDAVPVIRSISGGWLVQQEDTGVDAEFKPVTGIPFPADKSDLARFGVMACKHVKSNAIGIFAATGNGISMIGAGMGNPNRLISMRQAVDKARENGHENLAQAVLVSDAFFPFADNIGIAKDAGIRHIIQPGGSIKDKDVITACNDAGIAMAFTGRRHFRH